MQTQSVSPVFVGRTPEMSRLTSALARAHAGEPQALVLGGEAGVGKTRLVEEFLTAACGSASGSASAVVGAVGGCVEIGLAAALESVGRSQEALKSAVEGTEVAARYGLREAGAWACGNQAEPLIVLGRLDEAEKLAARAHGASASVYIRGWSSTIAARILLLRGDAEAADGQLALARKTLGPHAQQPQNAIPLASLAIGVTAARGRFLDARAEIALALDSGFAPDSNQYSWPLLHTAAVIEGDAIGLPAAEDGRPEILRAIREAAGELPALAPVWAAYSLLTDAELVRAEGRDCATRWAEATTAFAALDRPYELAHARHRWEEALLASGAAPGEARGEAAALLAQAYATADRLGAGPLRAAVAQLAQRARVPLARQPADDAPAGAAEPFPLTAREHEVLCRVAAGYTNRRIAEELFISPKTASVHVSNILAKLGVATRGEAAALAHRLRLVS